MDMLKEFNTIAEAEEYVTKYLKDNCHPVRLESRTTVAQYNRKTKDPRCQITAVADSTVYSLRWVCKHFGNECVSERYTS